MDKIEWGGGKVRNFRRNYFCFTVPKISVGEPLVPHKIRASKFLCIRGVCHEFLYKICCLTGPKKLVGEHFNLSLFSGIEKC